MNPQKPEIKTNFRRGILLAGLALLIWPTGISAQKTTNENVAVLEWINRDLKSVDARDGSAETFELYSFAGAHASTSEARQSVGLFRQES